MILVAAREVFMFCILQCTFDVGGWQRVDALVVSCLLCWNWVSMLVLGICYFRVLPAELIFCRCTCLHFLGSHSRGAVGCIFVDMLKQQILMKVCPDLSGCVDVLLISEYWFCILYVFRRKDLTCIDK